jgi:Mn2+/Fe2+ NRAMP family transporter
MTDKQHAANTPSSQRWGWLALSLMVIGSLFQAQGQREGFKFAIGLFFGSLFVYGAIALVLSVILVLALQGLRDKSLVEKFNLWCFITFGGWFIMTVILKQLIDATLRQ